MGYYTDYSLLIVEDPKGESEDFLKELKEEADLCEIDCKSAFNGFNDKWYDREDDLRKVSKNHPEMLIELYGQGEEQDNIWDMYIQNGQIALAQGHIHYPRFDRKSFQFIEKESLDGMRSEVDSLLMKMYDEIRLYVESKGSLINTQDSSCDTIYSYEYDSIENGTVSERIIVGIRVKDNEIEIFTEPNFIGVRLVISDEDMKNPEYEDEWKSLKTCDEVIFAQTLLNIAEAIKQY